MGSRAVNHESSKTSSQAEEVICVLARLRRWPMNRLVCNDFELCLDFCKDFVLQAAVRCFTHAVVVRCSLQLQFELVCKSQQVVAKTGSVALASGPALVARASRELYASSACECFKSADYLFLSAATCGDEVCGVAPACNQHLPKVC